MSNLDFFHTRKNLYLNDNGKFSVSINFKKDGKLYVFSFNFYDVAHLRELIEYTKNINMQVIKGSKICLNNSINIYEEENPCFNSTGLLECLILIFDKEFLIRILSELIDFTNYRNSKINLSKKPILIEERVKFKLTQHDTNPEILALVEFENKLETEIDMWVLKFYSKKNNTLDALQFFIDKISDVLINKISEYKMFIYDEMIFETYFIISRNNSKYFGFIDNENASNPQYIADVNTKNLHDFLFFYKKILGKNF